MARATHGPSAVLFDPLWKALRPDQTVSVPGGTGLLITHAPVENDLVSLSLSQLLEWRDAAAQAQHRFQGKFATEAATYALARGPRASVYSS